MAFIELSHDRPCNMSVMVFAEGTVLKPKSALLLYSHKKYVPIGNCVERISGWQEQGAKITYCTSRRGRQAGDMAELLKGFGFCGTKLYYRDKGQTYRDIVELVKPDVLIEDDCRSIGGSWQMCITHVEADIKSRIKSVVVREFKGIDGLAAEIKKL